MNQSATRSHVAAFLLVLLMVFGLFGGMMQNNRTLSWGTPVYAGHGVDDLWGEINDDPTQGVGNNLEQSTTNMGTVVQKGKEIAQTITSILTIISFVSLLFWVTRLALSAGNPQTRRTAITGILVSGVALALFGGAWVVVSFFWNFLSGTSGTP